MKIAIIATPWTPIPPPMYGGIESVIHSLAVGFKDAGHDVLLYTTGDSTSDVPRAHVLEEAEHKRMGMGVPEMRHVMHAYEAVEDYDIVHDHTVIGPVYAERFDNVKVLTTNHGPFNEELADIYRRIAPRVPIIAISHAQHKPVPDLPIARVIHHGVDASQYPVGTGEGGYCLFLGRMSPEKGANRAKDAALKAGVPLMMAAKMREPWEHEYYESNVEPFLSEDVQYLGEVSHERKLELLSNAKCLLFPIRWNEPFGMVMIEAMACGTPVLAFPEGAAPEVVEDGKTGFLCRDESDMAEAISKVDQIDRQACRDAVEGYFSVKRMVHDHLDLFAQILDC